LAPVPKEILQYLSPIFCLEGIITSKKKIADPAAIRVTPILVLYGNHIIPKIINEIVKTRITEEINNP